jgi:oxygen-independent coproporphyrinogen-3 oxidase
MPTPTPLVPRRAQVSNYALPGHRSRHNQVYWRQQPCYAFGVGAASYLAGRRWSRPKAMAAYVAWVTEFVAAGQGLPGMHLPEESQVSAVRPRGPA